MSSKLVYLKQFQNQPDITVVDEQLQKLDDPVEALKQVSTPRLVAVVPAEYSWPQQLNPLKNPEHKRVYDSELLAEHLHEAGWEPYILRTVEGNGWSWLSAEAAKGGSEKKLNSKERRYLKRHPEGLSSSGVASTETSTLGITSSSSPASLTGTN